MSNIIQMLNALAGKSLMIETLNENHRYHLDERFKTHYGIVGIVADDQGNYLLQVKGAAQSEGEAIGNFVTETEELINLGNVTRIVLSQKHLPKS